MSQYANPIYRVLEYLESEKSRREQALKSNIFCDNKTIRNNIKVLDETIKTMRVNIDKQALLLQASYVSADSFAKKKQNANDKLDKWLNNL